MQSPTSDELTEPNKVTVGECKLFASLHFCVLIKPACLDGHPAVKGFYDAFAALPAAIATGNASHSVTQTP